MKEPQNVSIKEREPESSTRGNGTCDNLQSANDKDVKSESKIIQIPGDGVIKYGTEKFSVNGRETQSTEKTSNFSLQNNLEIEISQTTCQNPKDLFRLFVKNGEYAYARPNDIVMIESCDHMVKVYVAFNEKIKKTVRHNTLKDFLLQLPKEQFLRISRFCAVNIYRLSGGNCNDQTFEFDFRVSIKLKHSISQAAFGNIGK
jgi:hypothetical protein